MNRKITIAILIALLAVILLGNYFQNTEAYVAPVVDDRDGIQKVVDAYAESYRIMTEAELTHTEALEALNVATEDYNAKAEMLQTYTK